MKKISEKQKIIILIAIALIIVITGIIVGTNAIKVNISNGRYNSANNDSSNGNLLPEYIKQGVTIGGITGTLEVLDTSDATATAEDIAYGKTAYVNGVKITGSRTVSKDQPMVGYYADIEGDGTVDGIVYADLAIGGSGKWNNYSGGFPGIYTIPTKTNLKEYYIIKEEYTDDFGTKPVLAPIKGTSGEDRFYIMALDDIDTNQHYWYYNARGLANNDATQLSDFGTGKTKTETMITKWNASAYGAQNSNDMWGLIQDEYKKGWFIPSYSEWAAFGDNLKIGEDNYNDFNLNMVYWSSTSRGAYDSYTGVPRSWRYRK